MLRVVLGLIFAGLLTAFCLIVLIPFEVSILENQINVSPFAGTSQQQWLAIFQDTAFYQVWTAFFFSLAWLLASWYRYQIKYWKRAGGRLLWSGFLIVLLLFELAVGWFRTDPTQDVSGKLAAILMYVGNALLIFYLSSLLSSPTSVKYAPIGAVAVGRVNKFW